MQITSEAYRSEQKNHLRNEPYVYVYLGVISNEAQSNCVAEGNYTVYSDPDKVATNVPFEAYYATAEQNMARCDASQCFLPRKKSSFALYQGAVTQKILGTVKLTFGEYEKLRIKRLTIDFGDYYPTSFTITNGHEDNTYEYTNSEPGEWTCNDEFINTAYIQITAHSMVGGQQRLRILNIKFGKGFLFDNYNLISTSWKSEVAHLSDSLPTKTFTFTIDNLDRNFSADNPHSWVSFLQEQQEVSFEYGRMMDNGTIYKIPGGILNLKSWSSNDTQAKFTAVGNLEYISTKFYKGRYYENGITLYDLAEIVFEDAGIKKYKIDSYLDRVITHNPLPVENHKCLLQLIANAARAILFEDRDGTITIRTSFMPNVIDLHSNGQTDYSYLPGLLEEDFQYIEYATTEKDYARTDARQLFIPRDSSYEAGCYVSSMVSNSDGYFEGVSSNYIRFVTDDDTIPGIRFRGQKNVNTGMFVSNEGVIVDFNQTKADNPKLTIEWETGWTFYNMTLIYSDVYPKKLFVHVYRDGELVESIEQTKIEIYTQIVHSFYDVDKLVFEFVRTNPYQRIHLGKILFGDVSDYTLEYTDMSATPTASRTDWVRDINVTYSEFSYGKEEKNISTVAVVDETNTVTYSTPYHSYSLEYKEIKDDDTRYTKVPKVFCKKLPDVEDAKTNTRYFVRKSSYYKMYVVKTENNEKSWESLGNVTERIVSTLTFPLEHNVLYLLNTSTNLIYHLYMLDDTGSEEKTISLGYDVRGTLTIVESGAYYVTFTSNVASPVVVSGIAFLVNERTYTENLNELGQDKTAKNVLLDNLEDAKDNAEWLGEYFSNDVQYKIQYRGEPALDPDDQIYIENKFVEKNLIRITSTQIDTSTGMSMSCILNGRRLSYEEVDVARVDYAITDKSVLSE